MKKINKKSVRLRQLAYEEVRSAILKGNLKPGDPLVEMDLSERLGVSRTPLREAMALLEHEGLIETIPYKGTFIASLDRKEVEDLYDLRMVLEIRALELAIGKIPYETLKHLEQEIELSDRQEDNWLPILTTGNKLHALIAHYSGNKTLENLIIMFTERIHQYFAVNKIVFDAEHLKQETKEHRNIVRALMEGDPQKAREIMKIHLDNSYQRTVKFF
ncbi:GntR family transcriptional regulator [Brevibacillus massiliensis]|uniref:GntR family transcriptional regulator n=1 Tax=Brevibacillus massiliensis TaxID=1118054 RepID=UPI001375C07F|nr:GntR family transcriptional regulator [Brevibacillus massiliensis]